MAEAYQQEQAMDLPSSRRHRFVKIREEIVRSNKRGSRNPQIYATGLDPQPRDPAMRAAHQQSVEGQQKK